MIEPQSAPGLVVADCIELLNLWLKRIQSIWFRYWPSGDDFLCCWKKVFTRTSVFFWQNSISLCSTSFCTPSQICLLLQVFLDSLLLLSSPLQWKFNQSGIYFLHYLLSCFSIHPCSLIPFLLRSLTRHKLVLQHSQESKKVFRMLGCILALLK